MFSEPKSLIDRVFAKFIDHRQLITSDLYDLVTGLKPSIRGAIYSLVRQGKLVALGNANYRLTAIFRYQFAYKIETAWRQGRHRESVDTSDFYLKGTLLSFEPIGKDEQADMRDKVSSYFFANDGAEREGELSSMANEHYKDVHGKAGGGCTGAFDTSEEDETLSPEEMTAWQKNPVQSAIIYTHDIDIIEEGDNKEQVHEFEKDYF